MRFLTCLFMMGLLMTLAGPLEASVFQISKKWPTAQDGYTYIPVCIKEGSSTTQKQGSWFHAPNPSLSNVVSRVRAALQNSWERNSSVRFTGWKNCADLSSADRDQAIDLYINPEASNSSGVGYPSRLGTTQFKPWGNSFNLCINFSWSSWRMEYNYDCVEQYAIHEFGHAIGFYHEWSHPLVPSNCPKAAPLSNTSDYIIADDSTYDMDSIMTYWGGCVDQDGVRFGSQNLSPIDSLGVQLAYPAPAGASDHLILDLLISADPAIASASR